MPCMELVCFGVRDEKAEMMSVQSHVLCSRMEAGVKSMICGHGELTHPQEAMKGWVNTADNIRLSNFDNVLQLVMACITS